MDHEPPGELSAEARDFHRALESLKEEIEAIDWYHQRAQLASTPELRRILEHNRDEEIEHACIVLEWLRRSMPGWHEQLKTYLFAEGEILELEKIAEGSEGPAGPGAGRVMRSLGLKVGRDAETR
jgi:uncharacterized protein